MPRRTHPSYIVSIALGVVLVISAASLIRQPHVVTFSSKLFLSHITSAIKPNVEWHAPLVDVAPPTFPPGSRVAGVDVGGRTVDEATALVTQALGQWQTPLPLVTDTAVLPADTPSLDLQALGVTLDVPALIEQAKAQLERNAPVDVLWSPQLDQRQLRTMLTRIAPRFAASPTTQAEVTPGNPSQVTFRAGEYRSLDVEATALRIEALLRTPSAPITGTVVLRTARRTGTLDDLDTALRQQLAQWDGVAGVAVHDLQTGEWLSINDNTVFSGASVMKVPVLVYAYAKLGTLSPEQQAWANAMILESDNMSADNLLATSVGGEGSQDALRGAQDVTTMLHAVGLNHMHLLVPYDDGEWLGALGLLSPPLPPQEGTAPYTVPGDYLRATPRQMAQFFTMVVQCQQGGGALIDYWQGALTPKACGEILALLARPHDTQRMRAGIPDGVQVAHKGGWLQDMQADVGVVYSPNHTYVAAIYLWRDGLVTDEDASPSPYLGALSHTIYSFYNPD